jgi:tRNA A37 threonylcarbamoyladenosine dehydratase
MRQDFFQFSYLRDHMRTENSFLLRIQRKKIRLSLHFSYQNVQILFYKNGGCAEKFLIESSQVRCDLKTALCRLCGEETSTSMSSMATMIIAKIVLTKLVDAPAISFWIVLFDWI